MSGKRSKKKQTPAQRLSSVKKRSRNASGLHGVPEAAQCLIPSATAAAAAAAAAAAVAPRGHATPFVPLLPTITIRADAPPLVDLHEGSSWPTVAAALSTDDVDVVFQSHAALITRMEPHFPHIMMKEDRIASLGLKKCRVDGFLHNMYFGRTRALHEAPGRDGPSDDYKSWLREFLSTHPTLREYATEHPRPQINVASRFTREAFMDDRRTEGKSIGMKNPKYAPQTMHPYQAPVVLVGDIGTQYSVRDEASAFEVTSVSASGRVIGVCALYPEHHEYTPKELHWETSSRAWESGHERRRQDDKRYPHDSFAVVPDAAPMDKAPLGKRSMYARRARQRQTEEKNDDTETKQLSKKKKKKSPNEAKEHAPKVKAKRRKNPPPMMDIGMKGNVQTQWTSTGVVVTAAEEDGRIIVVAAIQKPHTTHSRWEWKAGAKTWTEEGKSASDRFRHTLQIPATPEDWARFPDD